jgi:hypothetical protein
VRTIYFDATLERQKRESVWNFEKCFVLKVGCGSTVLTRHVPQLSENGREDGQRGKYRREKSWDSEIVIDNQQKSGVREQSLKKRGYDFAARRAREHAARR